MKNNRKRDITIIVMTCDIFEDCWHPFFSCFKKFWPNCEYPIVLANFEKRYINQTKLDISNLNASKFYESIPSWSEIFLRSIKNLSDDSIILLMLDDYFISDYVDYESINKCYDIMQEYKYSNITLTNHDKKRTYKKTNNELISKIDQKSKYRVSTSPALWRVSSLRKYLISDENPWMFELFGTIRSHKIKDSFYRFNEKALTPGFKEVVPYFQTAHLDTAIVQGKWQIGVDKFFKKLNIDIDFSERGFYKTIKPNPILRKIETILTIIKHPKQIIRALFS
jgi:hypothetical protein